MDENKKERKEDAAEKEEDGFELKNSKAKGGDKDDSFMRCFSQVLEHSDYEKRIIFDENTD